MICLLYTSDAADEEDSVEIDGRRINNKKNKKESEKKTKEGEIGNTNTDKRNI